MQIYPYFKIDRKITNAADDALRKAAPAFARIEDITDYNQQKMLAAFIADYNL